MDDLLKRFRMRSVDCISQYGFKNKGNVYFRIVNDVFQSFDIEKLKRIGNKKRCRIGFSVLPLCQKLEVKWALRGIGIYYLRRFEVTHWTEGDGWKYEPNDEGISACINEMIRYINSYLLPFFERANSCKTALSEVIATEKLFNENRKEGLRQSGIEDEAGPGAGINLFDTAKYYMALKNGDYDFALTCRKALLQQNINAYESAKSYISQEGLKRRQASIRELQGEVERLEAGDFGYFQKQLDENEAYSKEVLKNYIK